MTDHVDVVVVGAGMLGSAAGKYLSSAGADVLVVGPGEPEQSAQASVAEFGAYFDEARITRRLGWDPVWGALDSRSLERFRRIEAESGVGFFHECGSLILMAGSITQRTEAILSHCAREGIEASALSAEQLRRELPQLRLPALSGGVEGLYEAKQAGYINPRALVRAQLNLTASAGGRVRRGVVSSVEKDRAAGVWRLRVETPEGAGQVAARQVLVATGSLANSTGALPADRKLALHVFTEPNLLFEVPADRLEGLLRLPTVVTVDPEDTGNQNQTVYLLPPIRYPDGRWYMRIGPGMQPLIKELSGPQDIASWYAGQRILAEQRDFLLKMMRLLVPAVASARASEACCIIEKTPSRYPYIGHLDGDDTISVAVGGNGHGARGSDEIGRLAAATVLGTPWDSPVPRETFTPMLVDATRRVEIVQEGERPGYLKPPFGLC